MISTQIAPHVITRFAIPRFSAENSLHRTLSVLSKQAHEAAATGDTVRVQEIESEIDLLAAQLWSLTDEELADIQRSLEELK